jgi:hypothetical protein
MNFAVYMKSKTGTPEVVLCGVFLSKVDASLYFQEINWESDSYSFHMDEVDSWAEWSGIRKKLT